MEARGEDRERMSTTSQHLGIKIPDGSDPFLRTDFVQNYNILDQYPGDWICTSTTRPVWGAGQAGMKIIETDTRRTLMWTGTTWREMLYGPGIWTGHHRPDTIIPVGGQLDVTLGTFVVSRPGTIFGMLTIEVSFPCRGSGGGSFLTLLDGAESNIDAPYDGEFAFTSWPDTSTMGTGRWVTTIPSMGVRNISSGTHSIGVRVQTSGSTAMVKLTSIRALAMFVNGTDR